MNILHANGVNDNVLNDFNIRVDLYTENTDKCIEFLKSHGIDEHPTNIKNWVKYSCGDDLYKKLKNKYAPEEFLFIFPFISKNALASVLESKLQEYWTHKIESDDDYLKEIFILKMNIRKKNMYNIHIYIKMMKEHQLICQLVSTRLDYYLFMLRKVWVVQLYFYWE